MEKTEKLFLKMIFILSHHKMRNIMYYVHRLYKYSSKYVEQVLDSKLQSKRQTFHIFRIMK